QDRARFPDALHLLRPGIRRETGPGPPRLRRRGPNRRGDVSPFEGLANERGPRGGLGRPRPDGGNVGARTEGRGGGRRRRPRGRSHGVARRPRRPRGESDPGVPRPDHGHRRRRRGRRRRLRPRGREAMKIAIVGGSGYTGGELLRLLLRHPKVEVGQVTSDSMAGKPVSRAHPNLRKVTDLVFTPHADLDSCDLLFLAMPHGRSMVRIPEFLVRAGKVIDLSADFRLKDPALYREYYGVEHPRPDLLATCHVFLRDSSTTKDLWKIFRDAYGSEPFVRIVTEASGLYRFPEPKILAGTNFCDVGFAVDPHAGRVVAVAALDNLMKGAAGTAVQCMNLVAGYPETMGLEFLGLHPA